MNNLYYLALEHGGAPKAISRLPPPQRAFMASSQVLSFLYGIFHLGKIRNSILKKVGARESLQLANVDLDYSTGKSQQKEPSPPATSATGHDVLCSNFSNTTRHLVPLMPHREWNHWVRRLWSDAVGEKKSSSRSSPAFKYIWLIKDMLKYDSGFELLK